MIELLHTDCMEYMATLPDKAFELAVVDPPYGIGEGGNNTSRHHSQAKYKESNWDESPPPVEYFQELMRVSKNQIIWGANHFISRMPFDSSCWIYWHKDRYGDFADGELAWSSFKTAVRAYKLHGTDLESKCLRIEYIQLRSQYSYINGY
jgi:site-specific DNA-methyltransferase (adenine-specific)